MQLLVQNICGISITANTDKYLQWCRYNFMPLARGTAAVGYMTLLSVFMAAGMPIEAQIPEVPPVTKCLLISISWNRDCFPFFAVQA